MKAGPMTVGPAGTASAVRLLIAGLHSRLAGPFDLQLAPGECVGVQGPSGSGKSLFLRMVADLDPNEGTVVLDGRARSEFSPPEWRRRVAYVAAEPGWWVDRVAGHFAPDRREAALALMPRLGLLPAQFEASVVRLSTGERQRLALIRTLVLQPPVLLLDEPTGALDEPTTLMVEAVLKERLVGGTSVIAVTHSAAQAGRLASRQFHMANRHLSPA
jgi:ABC-type iron transport system FetAB ATPase subunit